MSGHLPADCCRHEFTRACPIDCLRVVLAAAGDATGELWYWFGHAERITSCDSPAKAAEAVVRALASGADSAAEPAAPAAQRLAKGTRR